MADTDSLLSVLRQHAKSVICDLQEKDLLTYGDTILKFPSVDQSLLLLSNLTLDSEANLLVIYPVSKREIILPVCVDLLYNLYDKGQGRRKLLLYTDMLKLRYLYMDFNTRFMRFNVQFPVGLVRFDGSLKPSFKISTEERLRDVDVKFIMTNAPNLMPSDEIGTQIGGMVVDLDTVDSIGTVKFIQDYCREKSIKTVLFFGTDYNSPLAKDLVKRGVPCWAWDEKMVRDELKINSELLSTHPEYFDNPFSSSILHIQNMMVGITRNFVRIDDPSISPILTSARAYYHELMSYSDKHNDPSIKEIAFRLIASIYCFERMISPIEYAERESRSSYMARSFIDRISRIKSLVEIVSKQDKTMAESLGKAYSILETLYDLFSKTPIHGKATKLLELCHSVIEKRRTCIVIAPAEPSRRATERFICDHFSIAPDSLLDSGITVVSIDTPLPPSVYDICVFFGQVSFRNIHQLKVACAREMVFLCYDSEFNTVKYQVHRENFGESELSNPESRKKTLMELIPELPTGKCDTFVGIGTARAQQTSDHFLDGMPKNLFSSLIEEEANIEDVEYFSEDDASYEEKLDDTGERLGIQILFEDNSHLMCRYSKMIPFIHNGKFDYKEADKTVEGESILLIDDNVRTSLTEKIFKKAGTHPAMQRYQILLGSWKSVLNEGMVKKSLANAELLAKIKSMGSKITHPLVIFFWRKGLVLAPRDIKDIQRIGTIMDEPTLVAHYREIGAAATRVRGIHIKLVKMLNKQLIEKSMNSSDMMDDTIDEEFDLHLEDFINSVSIKKVKAVKKGVILDPSKTDRLIK